MNRRFVGIIFFTTVAISHTGMAIAQTETPARQGWQDIIGSVLDDSDNEAESWEDTYDILQELADNPIDINSATKEDLERIPFLDDNDIQNILEYLYRNGKMLSEGELTMIPSLTMEKRTLLQFFITVNTKKKLALPKFKDLIKYGDNSLTASGNIPLYERKGDKNGYLGYKYRHSIRYEYSYNNLLRIGMVGAQDAGEPFFSAGNGAGYDFYSFYADVRKIGRLKSLTVGRYRIGMGMGLIMNNSLSFGKSVSMASLSRRGTTVRPHSSRSSYNYLQGAAATVNVARNIDMTGFVSYKWFDATLNNDDGSIATIIKSGYHRTQTEMDKKNNASQLATGMNLHWALGRIHVGVSGIYASLSRELKPKTSQLYRKYYAAGKQFYNMSMDYSYTNGKFSFHGETATGDCHAWATINAAAWRIRNDLSVTAIQRFYAYKYYSLFSQSFSDGGSVQNESGMYLGIDWQPVKGFSMNAYSDIAYFPWAKYQAASASHSFDNMLSVAYNRGRITVSARYRVKVREKDNADKTALINHTTQRGRFAVRYDSKAWNAKAQFDSSLSTYKDRSFGYMTALSGGCSAIRKLAAYAAIGYFHTQDYNSRIYSYERGMAYDFSFPSYYGEGIHYAVLLSTQVIKNVTLSAKVSTTDYFDRNTIGSALQQIDRSAMTDIQVQAKWKF